MLIVKLIFVALILNHAILCWQLIIIVDFINVNWFIVQYNMVAQKGHPSLPFFKVTFCKLAVFQFYTFANMQFINQACLQICCLSICIQYPNSKGHTVKSSENHDVYAQEMHIIFNIIITVAHTTMS